jgi:hypothetical protein
MCVKIGFIYFTLLFIHEKLQQRLCPTSRTHTCISALSVLYIRPRRSRSLRTFFAPNLRNGTLWERERSQPDQRSHEFVL